MLGWARWADQPLGSLACHLYRSCGPGRRRSGHDPVDPPHAVAAVEVYVLLEGFRHRFGGFDELAVHVHHVERPVRSVGEIAGPEPDVGRGQKLPVGLAGRAAGQVTDSVGPDQIPVHQVGADVAGEEVAAIGLGEQVAPVDGASGGSAEIAPGVFHPVQLVVLVALLPHAGAHPAPTLGLSQGEDANQRLAVVGNVQSRRPGDQVGVAAQVAPGEYHVPNVGGVRGDEAVPPIVHGDAELTRAGGRLEEVPVQAEAKIGSLHRDRGGVGPAAEGDLSRAAVVGGIDPVVHPKAEVGDAGLGVDQGEAGEENFAMVGKAVSGGVFQVEDVRGGRDQQAALPGKHAGDLLQAVGENSGSVQAAVAVAVLQQTDAASG